MGKICGCSCGIYFCGSAIAERCNAPGVEYIEIQHVRSVILGLYS